MSAGVNTLARAALTLLIKRTILQPIALRLTAYKRVPLQPIWARTDHIVITPDITPCPCPAWVIRTWWSSTCHSLVICGDDCDYRDNQPGNFVFTPHNDCLVPVVMTNWPTVSHLSSVIPSGNSVVSFSTQLLGIGYNGQGVPPPTSLTQITHQYLVEYLTILSTILQTSYQSSTISH